MLKKFIRIIGGDPNKREIDRLSDIVDQINELEPQYAQLSDQALQAKTSEFRQRIAERTADSDDDQELFEAEQEALNEILPEAFAAVREASKRTLGLRHYDVQLLGGMALHSGKISEMRTGEGKTLVATLPVYLNALAGHGVHLITVNDYLARRDARWMAPIYNLLGMSVGVLQMAARTENGKRAFLVDLSKESPHEDQNQLVMVPRVQAYAADITYGTNSEFGFDYLRDNMAMRLDERVQRGHYYAIIDEVDNVLIDEARTPLIISGPAQDEGEWYIKMAQVVRALRPDDYEVNEKDRNVTLTELGEAHVEELLAMPLRDPERPEDVTLEQARILGYLEQAMRAQYLFKRNKDYLVQAGKVIIVDEFTGRMMPGRRWSDGLHQAVEAKEGVKVESESVTYATITIQNYFRMYKKLAGMSGTALTEAEEFDKIYKLGVLPIPTNLEYQAQRAESGLTELEAKDSAGYKYSYYTRKEDPLKAPLFWRRQDFPDVVYRSQEVKMRSIVQEILRNHVLGRPVLVGTTSVELSERLSNRLRADPLRRLAQSLLIRDAYVRKHNIQEDGRRIEELQGLYANPVTELDTGMLRKWCRDLGISFNPEDPSNLVNLLNVMSLPENYTERLASDLAAGIPHQVLNARKHTEESQIIAGAGAFGAVTIATNMAGRGVDIKLGGELAEEISMAVNRVLSHNNFPDPYDMTMEERLAALQSLDPANYGIYEPEIQFFFQHMQEMEQVKSLGGLHVVGSERHEARRIDNQLRGRAARQGDPGSSRFFLSMEDDLMRLFGGQQADSMMQRLKVDEALPLEVGLVSRLIEQSQTRVEGSNFDVRKHLLEYDDVLNTQRARIYGERDRIFVKEDLTEDVIGMLRTELAHRVPEALKDEGGPWKLLAWLDQIQPPITLRGAQGQQVYPSFSYRLLVEQVLKQAGAAVSAASLRRILLEIATQALEAESHHHLQAVHEILASAEERMQTQIEERMEAVDTFFEGLSMADETDTRQPTELVSELSNAARLPLKMSTEEARKLRQDGRKMAAGIKDQINMALRIQAVSRMLGAVERRIEESLEMNPTELAQESWQVLSEQIAERANELLDRRQERLVGENGQIVKDLNSMLERLPAAVTDQTVLALLMQLPQGARASFDKRTHRRVVQRTTRLTYIYYAASLLEDRDEKDITEAVLDHLEEAQQAIHLAWGQAELNRLAAASLADVEETARRSLLETLGLPEDSPLVRQPMGALPDEERAALTQELGRRALTGIYRQLLLSVITELWVDYLTQMEALRVSIGLEAYAQRDPLVQYKGRAGELYQALQSNIRMGVVTRMFTYRPRDLSQVQAAAIGGPGAAIPAGELPEEEEAVEAQAIAPDGQQAGSPRSAAAMNPAAVPVADPDDGQDADAAGGKKRKRRRR